MELVAPFNRCIFVRHKFIVNDNMGLVDTRPVSALRDLTLLVKLNAAATYVLSWAVLSLLKMQEKKKSRWRTEMKWQSSLILIYLVVQLLALNCQRRVASSLYLGWR